MKDLAQMIEEINKAVDRTLSITYYTGWDLYSYRDGTLFSDSHIRADSFSDSHIRADSFTEVIEKAYKILKEKEESNGTK